MTYYKITSAGEKELLKIGKLTAPGEVEVTLSDVRFLNFALRFILTQCSLTIGVTRHEFLRHARPKDVGVEDMERFGVQFDKVLKLALERDWITEETIQPTAQRASDDARNTDAEWRVSGLPDSLFSLAEFLEGQPARTATKNLVKKSLLCYPSSIIRDARSPKDKDWIAKWIEYPRGVRGSTIRLRDAVAKVAQLNHNKTTKHS